MEYCSGMSKPIVVLGSVQIEFLLAVEQLPQQGEVARGAAARPAVGGSGARAAAAAARAGASVVFAGCTGDDLFGAWLRDVLRSEGVNVEFLQVRTGTASGTICTVTAHTGETFGVSAPGANALLTTADVDALDNAMRGAGLVVVDSGIAPPVLEYSVSQAFHLGQKVLLRLSTGERVSERHLRYVHTLVIDGEEAAFLTGQPVNDLAGAQIAACSLIERGPLYAVVCLPGHGVAAAGPRIADDYPNRCLGAAGAGSAVLDSFTGRLAAALAAGESMQAALNAACQDHSHEEAAAR